MVQEREGIEMAQVARKIRTGKHVSEGDSGGTIVHSDSTSAVLGRCRRSILTTVVRIGRKWRLWRFEG
jgi:hypothetical protein